MVRYVSSLIAILGFALVAKAQQDSFLDDEVDEVDDVEEVEEEIVIQYNEDGQIIVTDNVNMCSTDGSIKSDECCMLTRKKAETINFGINFCTSATSSNSMSCCSQWQDRSIKEWASELFHDRCISEYARESLLIKWFCVMCDESQPKWVTYESFADYQDGAGTYEVTATVHVCEEFARELYGADINERSTNYDNCELNIYSSPPDYLDTTDGGLGLPIGALEIDPQIMPTMQSFAFENALEFFNSEMIKPPYWREDFGHSFTIDIVPEGVDQECFGKAYVTEEGAVSNYLFSLALTFSILSVNLLL